MTTTVSRGLAPVRQQLSNGMVVTAKESRAMIDAVRERISPAFLQEQYQTFARGLLPTRAKASPHALPPRSLGASMIKAALLDSATTAEAFAPESTSRLHTWTMPSRSIPSRFTGVAASGLVDSSS